MSAVPGPAKRLFRTLVAGVCTFVLFEFVSLYLSWPKQALLGGLVVLLAIALNRFGKSQTATLALMLLSMAATLRYGWWRVSLVIGFFTDESNHRFSLDAALMLVLLSAEVYTFCIMVLGYMQTSHMLRRRPVPLPADVNEWPDVDLLIPTYNEPLSLVRYTALAAVNIDYPPEKLHVYVLDDGTREEFRDFCADAGIGYIVREKHTHAKAGNINHALTKMNSPLVTIFDCDHVPTRSFLQCTAGWFLADTNLAMLQTPHYFYSPDPFERNLLQFTNVPSEGELFYGLIQDGNDLWNATFFCGSCAVIRREALDEVGGIATETVTEDAHTSLRMQKAGWDTAYINMAQAAGLATETLAAHVGQRVRWARGMIQILRTDCPLFARGMKLTQRLCYFNAMMHFMYAVPRLIFLIAPLAYMLLGRTIIPGYWVAILAYALPHLLVSGLTNSRIQGTHRHSFWNEIYETVLAPYILLPTVLALINPKLGKFNVTDKGTTLAETRFDVKIAAPTTWLIAMNFLGVLAAPYRLFVLDPQHPGVVLSNLLWILFNIVILGVAAAVAHEQKQRRTSVRIPVRIPLSARTPEGTMVDGVTSDMSVGGASVTVRNASEHLRPGQTLQVGFPMQTGDDTVLATVVGVRGSDARLRFDNLSLPEQETLTRALYSRADSWISVREKLEADRPLLSLWRITRLSLTGLTQVACGILPKRKEDRDGAGMALVRSAGILLLMLLAYGAARLHAQQPSTLAPQLGSTPASADTMTHRITLRDMGVLTTAPLPRAGSYGAHFVLPYTLLPRSAVMNVGLRFTPRFTGQEAMLRVSINNTPVASILEQRPTAPGEWVMHSFRIPPELLIRDNDITFQLTGASASADNSGAAIAEIASASDMVLQGDPLPFHHDLALLPMPLLDPGLQTATTIPFSFLSAPDTETLQAAGVVASWFGLLASTQPVHFATVSGAIPKRGNAVVFALSSPSGENTPAGLPILPQQPGIALRTNPNDPTGTLLILSAPDSAGLLAAARELAQVHDVSAAALTNPSLQRGDTELIGNLSTRASRPADDAPRWLPSDRSVSLTAFATHGSLATDGSAPVPIYFRLPPDLFYGEAQNLALTVSYRYNGAAVSPSAALRTYVNGTLINEAPLDATPGMHTATRRELLPLADLRPFANTLIFRFDIGTGTASASQLRAQILSTTSLDLRGFAHWATLPDLQLFANAGFPFTRYADLSNTVVVLPTQPRPEEINLFLNILGHAGRQTGAPALGVTVATPDSAIQPQRDYLVLGTYANQAAFNALSATLPVAVSPESVRVVLPDSLRSRLESTVSGLLHQDSPRERLTNDAILADAVMEGVESPYAPGHSLVAIALRDGASEQVFANTFLDRSQSSDVNGSVSLLRGSRFVSYDLPTPQFHVGTISPYAALRIWLARYFVLLLLLVAMCTLLLGRWMREWLHVLAEERLRPGTVATERILETARS